MIVILIVRSTLPSSADIPVVLVSVIEALLIVVSP